MRFPFNLVDRLAGVMVILAWMAASWMHSVYADAARDPGTRPPPVSYDPLAIPDAVDPRILDLTVHDAARDRDIPLRFFLPAAPVPAPVILFSHGLGGSREGNRFMGWHWAARGYAVVFLQHPGSDESVWRDRPPAQRMAALEAAAGRQNFMLRIGDVAAVIDALDRWQADAAGSPLPVAVDAGRLGMAGHSFGAMTTQALSGQQAAWGRIDYRDARVKAALMLSPSGPLWGGGPRQAFGAVPIPWMLITGTRDVARIGQADVASRLSVFPALPPGGKYELVLEGAEHSAFTDRVLPGETGDRHPNHHRALLAVSTAFWDAWLRDDGAARSWLDGEGALSVLEPGDRWQIK